MQADKARLKAVPSLPRRARWKHLPYAVPRPEPLINDGAQCLSYALASHCRARVNVVVCVVLQLLFVARENIAVQYESAIILVS